MQAKYRTGCSAGQLTDVGDTTWEVLQGQVDINPVPASWMQRQEQGPATLLCWCTAGTAAHLTCARVPQAEERTVVPSMVGCSKGIDIRSTHGRR